MIVTMADDGPGVVHQVPASTRSSELKRSWWILLTLVPFGWLAFAAFFYIGHKAKESSWKLWALGYFLLAWTATVVASVEELSEPVRQAGGMVMLFVAWPLPFVHALRVRRRFLDETAGAPNGGMADRTLDDPAPGDAPGAEGVWRPKRRSIWLAIVFIFFSVFGAAQLLFGQGTDRIWGAISLLFFGAGGIAVYAPKGKKTGGAVASTVVHGGQVLPALVFELDPRRHRIRTVASLAFGMSGGIMAAFAGEMGEAGTRYSPAWLRIVGIMLLVFAGGAGLMGLRSWGSISRLALLRDGLLSDVASTSTFVPWDAIASVGVFSMHGNEMLCMQVNDRRRIEAGRVTKALVPVSAWLSPADLSHQLDAFIAEPEVVVATVLRYFEHPEERDRLGSGEEQISLPDPIKRS
jgi:hypothetical protein